MAEITAGQERGWRRWGLYAQSAFYLGAGANHFWHATAYRAIMPRHYTHPAAWVAVTGVAEMAGGVGLLVPRTRRTAAVGIAAMLVGFLDVHVDMLRHAERYPGIPLWALWARLPLQAGLIGWAWMYARKTRGGSQA